MRNQSSFIFTFGKEFWSNKHKYSSVNYKDNNTIATSPFSIVGIPSNKPNIILLLPNMFLIGIPFPVT